MAAGARTEELLLSAPRHPPALGLGQVAGGSTPPWGWACCGGDTALPSPPTCLRGHFGGEGGCGVPIASSHPRGCLQHPGAGVGVLPLPWWHDGTGTGAARKQGWWQGGGVWHCVALARVEAAQARIRAVGQGAGCQGGRAPLSSCPLGLCPPTHPSSGRVCTGIQHRMTKMPPPCWGKHTSLPTPSGAGGCPQHPCLPARTRGAAIPPVPSRCHT